MGQAKARAKEIAELKRHGRLIDTPRYTQPVLAQVGDHMWIVMNSEFEQDHASVMSRVAETPQVIQRELARLALTAERSGVRERECEAWFRAQCNAWADAVLKQPVKGVIFAQNHK